MLVTIHQPEFLPWLGYFNKMLQADLFVLLDSVQYRKNYFENRNRIYSWNTEDHRVYLTVPVTAKDHLSSTLRDIYSPHTVWVDKHLRTIRETYSKTPYYDVIYPMIEEAYLYIKSNDIISLCDIDSIFIYLFRSILGIYTPMISSSTLGCPSHSSDLILDICNVVGASDYLAGPSGRDYLDLEKFSSKGIRVHFNDFDHPEYTMIKGRRFVSHLSVLDALFNVGIKATQDLVRSYTFNKEA